MDTNETAKKRQIGTLFLPVGLHSYLIRFAKQRQVRVLHLVEYALQSAVASGKLAELCEGLEPSLSEKRLLVENATKEPLRVIAEVIPRSVPRRARAVVRRLEEAAPLDRGAEFEKLKILFQYPGTHLDSECELASDAFLGNWKHFTDSELLELREARALRANIYSQWQKSHADISAQIADAEKRLARNTGRAHRVINAELRRLRAMRTEFEQTVRWNLRAQLGKTL